MNTGNYRPLGVRLPWATNRRKKFGLRALRLQTLRKIKGWDQEELDAKAFLQDPQKQVDGATRNVEAGMKAVGREALTALAGALQVGEHIIADCPCNVPTATPDMPSPLLPRPSLVSRVKHQLARRGIVALSGAAGVGKTHLAAQLVHDRIFDVAIWVDGASDAPDTLSAIYTGIVGENKVYTDVADAMDSFSNLFEKPDDSPRDSSIITVLCVVDNATITADLWKAATALASRLSFFWLFTARPDNIHAPVPPELTVAVGPLDQSEIETLVSSSWPGAPRGGQRNLLRAYLMGAPDRVLEVKILANLMRHLWGNNACQPPNHHQLAAIYDHLLDRAIEMLPADFRETLFAAGAMGRDRFDCTSIEATMKQCSRDLHGDLIELREKGFAIRLQHGGWTLHDEVRDHLRRDRRISEYAKRQIQWMLAQLAGISSRASYSEKIEKIDALIPNANATIENALQFGSDEDYVKIALGFSWRWNQTGEYRLAIKNLAIALAAAERLGDYEYQSEILKDLGIASFRLGDYGPALEYFNRKLALNRARRSIDDVQNSQHCIGLVLALQGKPREALPHYRASLRLQQRAMRISPSRKNRKYSIDSEKNLSMTQLMLASAHRELARRAGEEDRDISLGDSHIRKARILILRSLRMGRRNDIPEIVARSAEELGKLALLQSRPRLAMRCFRIAAKLFKEAFPAELPVISCWTATATSMLATQIRDPKRRGKEFQKCKNLVRDAFARAKLAGGRRMVRDCHLALARVHVREGELRKARIEYEKAVRISRAITPLGTEAIIRECGRNCGDN